ncbi:hypothetical protein [Parasegetibacter sp. NRK P23]|uniref:hypothetical protein n=1 Tax=Parasegetibacter sp. NRK P23 TaxID=2942999 RepID=UPI0020433F4C|nr:hypothetical protein [Parasegetibacter sp. NRK P23]MCM5528306.1 hypothetical protein [Parasegetibacter sp. NRK P23]
MQTKKPSELTAEELTAEEKKRKGIYIVFSMLIGVMTGVSIYGSVKNGFSFFTVMPIIFFPLFLLNLKQYKEVKKEIKSRNIN